MKIIKKITTAASAIIIATSLTIAPAANAATTLKESFSGGTYTTCVEVATLGNYWTKSCWAKTVGYKGYHYVRAYIGGTSKSAAKAQYDTGRCFSNGDIERKCTTDKVYVGNGDLVSISFPTGYAKYGTKK